jgi:ATP-binding cassette, subfamily B, multidrug efflux pump
MIKLVTKYLVGSARACAIIAPLAMCVEVAMDLMQPILMAKVIDVGVAGGDGAYVLRTGALMLAMAIVGLCGGAACSLLATAASVAMSGKMREALFAKAQGLSFAEIDALTTSSLVTRLTNDVAQVQGMVLNVLRGMVRTPLTMLGGIAMAFVLSPRLSLVFCVALPLIVCGIAWVLKASMPLFTRAQLGLDSVNTIQRENLLGARVAKAFVIEARQAERFSAANDELAEASVRAQGLTFLLLPCATAVMNFCVVAVLWLGGRMVGSGDLEIGKVMAFINYLIQISNSLMMAVNLFINVSRAQASAARIDEVFALESVIVDNPEPRRPPSYDLEFQGVSFGYGSGGEAVLKDISFSLPQGETLGIIGATGSGKSSLACLIPRLYDVSSGRILLGGIDIRLLGLGELRRAIGMVAQESLLFSGSVESNLRFGDEGATLEGMRAACADAQAADFVEALPGGYKSPVEQRGRNFSGGQKQRLSIARSLLQDPKILILDDSTSAVDLKTEARLRAALAACAGRRTTIVIAQRLSAIMGADRILVLDFGRAVAFGTHGELLRSSEIYRDIAVSQLGEEVLAHAE